MTRHRMGLLGRGGIVVSLLLLGGASAPEAEAQELRLKGHAAPQTAWSQERRFAIGGRLSLEVGPRIEVVVEGLRFYMDTDGIAEPGVDVNRISDRASLNAYYTLTPGWRVEVYGGLGQGYLRHRLSLVVDGREEGLERGRWITNRVIGVRVPMRFGTPFLEWTSEISRNRPQVWAAGVRFTLLS